MLTVDGQQRLYELFAGACDLPREQWSAFLDQHCRDDPNVRAEVERLLRRDAEEMTVLPGSTLRSTGGSLFPSTVTQSPAAGSGSSGAAERGSRTNGPHPERIARYRILGQLGAGGMGVVYRAEQDHPRREVALKVIKTGALSDEMLRRFDHEASVLGRLRHPGIAQIYEAGIAESIGDGGGGQPFFAMELVQGKPLGEYVRDEALHVRSRLALLVKICDAVQHAHQKGVIHRDLKPANILVVDDPPTPPLGKGGYGGVGQPKILDFGVARVTDADLRTTTWRTSFGQLVGTLPYMSPEQIGGDPTELDTRSDVYALGVVGFELLSGRLPYDVGRTIPDAVRAVREDDPIRLSSLNKHFRGDIETIFQKALEKDKSRRYQSASDLAADIGRYLTDQPIAARPLSAWYQVSKFARRNRGVAVGLVATLVTLVGGVVGMTTFALRERTARGDAEHRRHEADIARTEAVRQKLQTEAVAGFQSSTLRGLDPEEMGRVIKAELRTQAEAGLQQHWVADMDGRMRRMTPDEVGKTLAALDVALAPGSLTEAARRTLDETLLTPAVRNLETAFVNAPDVQALLFDSIGEVYRAIGLYQPSERYFRKALDIRRAHYPVADANVAASLNNVGEALRLQGNGDDAKEFFNEALQFWRHSPADPKSELLAPLNNLGLVLKDAGDLAGAEQLFREALAIAQELYGDHHPDTATQLNALGTVLLSHGQLAAAEDVFRRALAIVREELGEFHPDVAPPLNSLGNVLIAKGDYPGAQTVFRDLVSVVRSARGNNHPVLATVLSGLANVLAEQGDHVAAELLFREALIIVEESLGKQHPHYTFALHNLAETLRATGDMVGAESLQREALAIKRNLLGDAHESVATELNSLAETLRVKGAYSEAEPLYRQALSIFRQTYGDRHGKVARTLNNIGLTLHQKGDFAQAEPLYREALAIDRENVGNDHPSVATTAMNLARLLYDVGNTAEAEPLYRESLDIRQRKLPPAHSETMKSRIGLSRTLIKLKRFAEAEAVLLEARELLRQGLGLSPTLVRSVHERLIETYEACHAAQPERGYEAKAAEARGILAEWQASTQPAAPASQPATASSGSP